MHLITLNNFLYLLSGIVVLWWLVAFVATIWTRAALNAQKHFYAKEVHRISVLSEVLQNEVDKNNNDNN